MSKRRVSRKSRFIKFIEFNSEEEALKKLEHHQIDILEKRSSGQYWISSSSPSGYISEKLLFSQLNPTGPMKRESVSGREIPYVEWPFPSTVFFLRGFAMISLGLVVVARIRNEDAIISTFRFKKQYDGP